MNSILKISAALILMGSLTGCGGFEYFLIKPTPVKSSSSTTSFGFGRIFGDAISRMFSCAFQAGFSGMSSPVTVEIETVEFNFIADQVRANRITDFNLFYVQMEPNESASLKSLVRQAYDKLKQGDELREKPVDMYEKLLAQVLLKTVAENMQVAWATVGSHVLVKGSKTDSYRSYTLALHLLHAGVEESAPESKKNYTVCQ